MTTHAASLHDWFGSFQVFARELHERHAAGSHGGRIAGLCFAVLMNIGCGIIQMRGPKPGQKLYALVIGLP